MIAVEIAVIVLLMLLNGLFAMSELAMVSSRRARLQAMADRHVPGARIALRLTEDPGRFLSTVQIGITLVGVVAGAYGGATLGDRAGECLETIPALAGWGRFLGVGGVLLLITFLSIVLGELIPKRIALTNPERTACVVAGLMRALSRIAAPFVWLLAASTEMALRLLGIHGSEGTTVTEEEVRALISEGTEAGVFAPEEQEMIRGVLRLGDRTVRAVMTPRPEVVWLDLEEPTQALLLQIGSGSHSSYPVCRGQLDEIVGIVHTRDLLAAAVRGKPLNLEAAMVRPLVVHDGMAILRLLDLMKANRSYLAVVVDEYGSVEGVVTLTDILESIAGDLPDADEDSEVAAVPRADGSWLVEGWMPIDEFEDTLHLRDLRDGDDFQTVAGLVLRELGRIPSAGDVFERDGIRFEVVDMDRRRIDKILVTPLPSSQAEGDI
ncbi:hypothetical protein F11_03875 [Rhodospirillum rubrum F11]|uniref:Hemolysin n=4 Tax=Rhodospirillum rubrum TaxID=1085 RepID=Q2RWD5_RHORT|nr:hemolysin family protein [Rhodospirillum rubrum]ABC21560.1 conserved hypothetical protein [Rhodospirillum rubrum ATCC 11170]AEO47245.1 hypothetical protein F11_03875 [Rhodospirillum rubrum F11]MBK5953179.1 HlyC/CorC family transporter [Rhodospirillum rubrum]QXG81229.1 hemolysin family protein [Rhodospirillum rubrum]